MSKEKFYMTTAIAYTSGKPHIGNTYEIVLADSIARFKRQMGYDVFFQTGTDEHGMKIEEKAKAAGITPKQFVDNVSTEIKRIWDLMNTSYDKFIRTTDVDHEKQVQKIFKKLYEKGDIYKGEYEGLYCTPCESFWTESQLVDGKCPDCGREVKPAKEEAYFLKLSKYADRLIEHINNHPEFIQPVSRKNEMMNSFFQVFRIYVYQEHHSSGVFQLILMISMLYMYGLMPLQTTLLVLVTIVTATTLTCLTKCGQQTFTLSVRILFVSILFTGLLSLWHLTFHYLSRYLVIHGF